MIYWRQLNTAEMYFHSQKSDRDAFYNLVAFKIFQTSLMWPDFVVGKDFAYKTLFIIDSASKAYVTVCDKSARI
jgi:hypothetical protein